MNRYPLILIAGAVLVLLCGLFVWRHYDREASGDVSHIELRPVRPYRAIGPTESSGTAKALSEEDALTMAATNPVLRQTNWYKSTTRRSAGSGTRR